MKNGYIALISAIIISLILMLIVVGTSQLGFNSRFNILDSEFKERSQSLATSCIEESVLRLTLDDSYSIDSSNSVEIDVLSDSCQIVCISNSWPKKVAVSASPNEVYTNLEVTFASPATLDSPSFWVEVPDTPSCN